MKRREFIASVGGALIVRFDAFAESAVPLNQVDSWVGIGADGTVVGYTGRCEFGQGFDTVQYQLVAEEMNVPIERVRLFVCDTAITPDQGVSSGSQGHPTEFGPRAFRQALATAMNALMGMASQQLNVPVEQLVAEDGTILVRGDAKRRVSYGSLVAGKKFNLAINPRATYRNPREYKVLGTSVPRHDIPAKVRGEFEYVHNVRVPGMLHGRVVRPPVVGAKVDKVDESSVNNCRVVVKGDFVGVVADKQWHAEKAAEALKVTWLMPATTLPPQANLYEWMKQQPTRDNYVVRADGVEENLTTAAKRIEATYHHPYQLHGSMGTSCAVADVRGESATIWSATQGVYPQRDSVAKVLGMPAANIRVIRIEGSGCYGLNGADTVTYDAAILSQAVGKPVRLQYTRKDEMTGADHFGPAYVINLQAGLDGKGQITAWDYEGWTLSKGGRPNANSPGSVVSGALMGFETAPVRPSATPSVAAGFNNNSNAAPAYGAAGTGTIKSERVLVHTMQSPFFTGPLRSPNRLQNSFANESFIDEIAAALKVDPVQYRLRHLRDPRLIEAMNAAAKAAQWDTRRSPKPGNARTGVVSGRGVAIVLYEGNNGYSGMVAEVEVNQETGAIVVKRFVVSQDSGPISNPDGIRNQMEGGALQGMSRALFETVRWDDRSLITANWVSYPIYRFDQNLPKVESVLINRLDVQQMGAGEGAITIVAAAIANAVFDATGARLREVPFSPARVLTALKARV
jgi:nicotinate dehydrogenase subunit B